MNLFELSYKSMRLLRVTLFHLCVCHALLCIIYASVTRFFLYVFHVLLLTFSGITLSCVPKIGLLCLCHSRYVCVCYVWEDSFSCPNRRLCYIFYFFLFHRVTFVCYQASFMFVFICYTSVRTLWKYFSLCSIIQPIRTMKFHNHGYPNRF